VHCGLRPYRGPRLLFEDALVQYREALGTFPACQDALNNIGNVLYKEGKYDEAIRH